MQRDVVLPERLQRLAELRGLLTGYQLLGAEQKRTSNAYLFYVENSYKALRGRHLSLQDREFFRSLVANEEALKAQLAKDPGTKDALGAFDAIAKAQDRLLQIRDEYNALERGFQGTLFAIARDLVRGAAERGKPNPERLREYRESNLPALTQELFSEAPIYPEFETLLLGHSLSKIRERLGPDHPSVKKLLGKESPEEVAKRVVQGTKLGAVPVRKQLWEGGAQAVAAASDPLLALAAAIDPDARAVRRTLEDEVESVVQKNHERIAQARFAVQGRTTYPDATFTLRLSYGDGRGLEREGEAGRAVHDLRGRVRAPHRPRPVRPAGELARLEGEAEPPDPLQLRHDERHHRRQLRVARDRQERARSSASSSTATSTRSAGTTGSTRR